MEQTIIIALDHTPLAEGALKFYLEKIHRSGNRVVLIHCIELPEPIKTKEGQAPSAAVSNLWKTEEARTKALEEKMKELLTAKQVPGVLKTASGKPGETICRIAEQENAAMIITGARNINKVQRTILGSVSDYLVSHAGCPVIVVRDPAEMERKRRTSGDPARARHFSGESFWRQRFASGGKKGQQQGSKGTPAKGSVREDDEHEESDKKPLTSSENVPPPAGNVMAQKSVTTAS